MQLYSELKGIVIQFYFQLKGIVIQFYFQLKGIVIQFYFQPKGIVYTGQCAVVSPQGGEGEFYIHSKNFHGQQQEDLGGGGEVPRDRNVLLQNRLQDRGAGFPRKSTTSKDISIFCVWRKVPCIKKYGRISNRIKKGKRVAEEVTFISK